MNKLKVIVLFLILLCTLQLSAEDYKASIFGIKSTGTILNTIAIQKTIDYLNETGGERIMFYVGHYLTGIIQCISNATIHLKEGVVLVGSTNICDYNINTPYSSLVFDEKQENIVITEKGVIDGQDCDHIHNNIITEDELKNDLRGSHCSYCIYLRGCKKVEIFGILIKNVTGWVKVYDQCQNLMFDRISVNSKAYWNNDGLDIVGCKDLKVTNSCIDALNDVICFKFYDAKYTCENVEVRNCVVRSSANRVKFGTVTVGDYKNFHIINNEVYNTYRSAFTLATSDEGMVENILADIHNTSIVIYLRMVVRWNKDCTVSMNFIDIQNVYADVPKIKPDVGDEFECSIEDLLRNVSPASIVGLSYQDVTNVTLRNIQVVYSGSANPNYSYCGIKPADLDSIPEIELVFSEFFLFKEFPIWGFHALHDKNITFKSVTLAANARDYRPANVMDEVEGVIFTRMEYNGLYEGKINSMFFYKSTEIVQNEKK